MGQQRPPMRSRRPRSPPRTVCAVVHAPLTVGCLPVMAIKFLEALTDEEAAELHAVGRGQTYRPAVTVFHEGDDAGPVVVLLSGRVKVATIGAGREAIVAVRGPGELIGELSAIDGGPRSATVT